MSFAYTGMKYLGSALRVALGAGAVLGGSYVLSRIKERQLMESRLDRLEQMVEKISSVSEEKPKGEPKQEC